MYPYITMIKKFKNQYVIEGCSLNNNFKIIIKKNYLFGGNTIDIQKSNKNIRPQILSFSDLYLYYNIDLTTSMKLFNDVS
jgi:hypothetical protein